MDSETTTPPVPEQHWPDRINQAYYGEFGDRFARVSRNRINWIASQVTGDAVLDVGCSQGILAVLLAREGFKVTAIDISEPSLDYAKSELEKETPSVIGRVRLVCAELAQLDPGSLFDTVVLGEVIEHQTQPERFIRHALRHLKPKGRLVLTTPFGVHPYPDHKCTLYPGTIETMVAGVLDVEKLEVHEGYIRLLGTHRPGAKKKNLALAATEYASASLKEEVSKLNAKIKSAENKAAALAKQQQTLKKDLTATQGQLNDANLKYREIQTAISAARKIEDRLASAEENNAALAGQLSLSQNEAESLRQEKSAAARTIAMLEAQAAELKEQQQTAEVSLAEARKEAAKLREEILVSRQAATHLEKEKAQAEEAKTALILRHNSDMEDRQKEIASLEARLERQAEVMEAKTTALENRVQVVREMISFQLGAAILEALKSPARALALPTTLWRIHLDAESRRKEKKIRDEIRVKGPRFRKILEQLGGEGLPAIREQLDALKLPAQTKAAILAAMAKELIVESPKYALDAAREAEKLDPKPYRAKWIAFRLYERGHITEPAALLAGPAKESELSASEQKRADEIAVFAKLKANLPGIPAVREPSYKAVAGSLLYVAASSLPYHTTGYTTRTHELLLALKESGANVTALTRPGYPWDRTDRLGDPPPTTTTFEGIEYMHRRSPSMNLPLDLYIEEATRAIAKVAKERRVAVIHAASNHVNALPALIAARMLGIPFAYEMRGLWDLSKASKVPGYDNSERFQLGMDLEAHVAKNADRLYVISNALGRFVKHWGVEKQRIHLLPNCVNPETIDRALHMAGEKLATFTVGYAGSLVPYEGLDLLIKAISRLKKDGLTIDARIIGDGPMRPELEAQAKTLGVAAQFSFTGKLSPDESRARLAETHVAVLPRRPDRVCEIIPPIKLVEAMSLGLPVIVSDLPALREESGPEAMVFPPENDMALADRIKAVMDEKYPHNGQLNKRLWKDHVGAMCPENVTWQRVSKAGSVSPAATEPKKDLSPASALVGLFRNGGAAAVIKKACDSTNNAGKTAKLLVAYNKILTDSGLADKECSLLEKAVTLDASEETLRALYWAYVRSKRYMEACRVVNQIEHCAGATARQSDHLAKLKAGPVYRLNHPLLWVEAPKARSIPLTSGHVCYVLHNSLPYSSGGYATRSYGVSCGLNKAGYKVHCVTRPGFPLDSRPELTAIDIPALQSIGDICYLRSAFPDRLDPDYAGKSAVIYEKQFREARPEIVIAASAYLSAMPALIAARRLGIPFIYEVRGLWEITRLSRKGSEHAQSTHFLAQAYVEAEIARQADHVFTLTQPMKEELAHRGVPAEQITLLPNSCDPDRFVPRACDHELKARLKIPAAVPVIGYIGTFVDYEGLDNLVEAGIMLKRRGREFRFLLVGNENTSGSGFGPVTEKIRQIAESGKIEDWIIMPGRIPHEKVESYYSLIDICPFPRKPLPVCEMVSPMKPLEALAMEKAVVVSSVRALTEMIEHGQRGLVFEKGNAESLANTLERLLLDTQLRKQLGRNGRQWVERERTWAQIGELAASVIKHVVAKHDQLLEEPELVS